MAHPFADWRTEIQAEITALATQLDDALTRLGGAEMAATAARAHHDEIARRIAGAGRNGVTAPVRDRLAALYDAVRHADGAAARARNDVEMLERQIATRQESLAELERAENPMPASPIMLPSAQRQAAPVADGPLPEAVWAEFERVRA